MQSIITKELIMKKGKLILIVAVVLVAVIGGLYIFKPKPVLEHTSTVNIDIIEELEGESRARVDRIDSLDREVDLLRNRKFDVDSATLDSMLNFLRSFDEE